MIGTELIWSKMKKAGKQILVTTITESLGTFIVVSLVFGLIFFACWYERNFLAQAAEKIRKLPDWTIFIIIVLSLTYLVWEGTIIWLLMRQSVKHLSLIHI